MHIKVFRWTSACGASMRDNGNQRYRRRKTARASPVNCWFLLRRVNWCLHGLIWCSAGTSAAARNMRRGMAVSPWARRFRLPPVSRIGFGANNAKGYFLSRKTKLVSISFLGLVSR